MAEDGVILNGGEGTPEPEPKPTTPPSKFKLKIAGEEKELPLEEVLKLATKAGGAEKRIEDAALALKFEADVVAMDKGDPEAFVRVAKKLGWSEARIQAQLKGTKMADPTNDLEDGDDLTDDTQPDPATSKRRKAVPEVVDFQNLSPAIQAVLVRQIARETNTILHNSLDTDTEIGYTMKQLPESSRKAVQGLAEELVKGRLAISGKAFGDGTHVLGAVMPQVRQFAKALATPKKSTSNTGLGPSPDAPNPDYPTDEPKHVSAAGGMRRWVDHIAQQVAYNFGKTDKGGKP